MGGGIHYGCHRLPISTKRDIVPQERTNRVEYATFAGIDVFADEDNTEPVITMALLGEGADAVLNVKVYGRADLNPETARNLANALNRFADQYQPQDQRRGIRVHAVQYPSADGKVITRMDAADAKLTAHQDKNRGYYGTDGKVYYDQYPVSASVYPEWERD